MAAETGKAERAVRAELTGTAPDSGLRRATVAAARERGVLGWVRRDRDGAVRVHAEGDRDAVAALLGLLERTGGGEIAVEEVGAEGHEQFAIRGVSAGAFVLAEQRDGRGRRFELRLEVDGVLRCWTLPKGPSMDPAVKRLAVAAADRDLAERGAAWDRGDYEQGGRVPWPRAIERGHAVFVLHGERLRGGFALQRTGGGERPRWLLIKRRDDEARPGSDVVAEAGG